MESKYRYPGSSTTKGRHQYSLSHSFPVLPRTIMTKKRRSLSLQAILVPSFLPSVTSQSSPTDSNYFIPPVTSPRASPPPSYLLDDDPFANLVAAPSQAQRSPPQHRSLFERVASLTPSPTASTKSFPARAPVTAKQKPAFAPKPSLPSLDTLSRMNVVLPKKLRKGRVGASLPFEPWDNPRVIKPPPSPIEEVSDSPSPQSHDALHASATITHGMTNLETSECDISNQPPREVIDVDDDDDDDDARSNTPIPHANVDLLSINPEPSFSPGIVLADNVPRVTPTPTPTPLHVSAQEFTSSTLPLSYPHPHADPAQCVPDYYTETEHVYEHDHRDCEPETESPEGFDLTYGTASAISSISSPPRSASSIAPFSPPGHVESYQTDTLSMSTTLSKTSELSESAPLSTSASASASASAPSFSLSRSTSLSNTTSPSSWQSSSGSRSPSAASSVESPSLLVTGGVPPVVEYDDGNNHEEDDVDEAILSLYNDDLSQHQPDYDDDVNSFRAEESWQHVIDQSGDVGRYGNQSHGTDGDDINLGMQPQQLQVIDGINVSNIGVNLDLAVATPLPHAQSETLTLITRSGEDMRGEVRTAVDSVDPGLSSSPSLLPRQLQPQPRPQSQQPLPPHLLPSPLQRNLSSSSVDNRFSSLEYYDDYSTSLSLSSSSTATATAPVKQTQYEYSSFVEAITDWRDATHREARDTTTVTVTSANTNGGVNADISSSFVNPGPGIVTLDYPEPQPQPLSYTEIASVSAVEDGMLASHSSSSHRLPGSSSSTSRTRTMSSASSSISASSRGRAPHHVASTTTTPIQHINQSKDQLLQQQQNGHHGGQGNGGMLEHGPYRDTTVKGYDHGYVNSHGRGRGRGYSQSTGNTSASAEGGAASGDYSSYNQSSSGNSTNGNHGIRTSGSGSGRLSSGSVVEDEDGYSRHRALSQHQGRRPSAFTGPPPSSFSLPLPLGSAISANVHNRPAVRQSSSSSVSGDHVTVNSFGSSFESEGEEDGDGEHLVVTAAVEADGLALPSPSASSTISTSTSTSSYSDNVPLAQSIPTALTAQKSIRKQAREERDQRRRERSGTNASGTSGTSGTSSTSRGRGEREGEGVRSRQTTLRPVGAGGLNVPSLGVYSSSQEAAIHAVNGASVSGSGSGSGVISDVVSRSESRAGSVRKSTPTAASAAVTVTKVVGRPGTQTASGRGTPPFSVDDLTRKLQDIQGSSAMTSSRAHRRYLSGTSSGTGNVDTHATFSPPPPSAASTLPVDVQSTTRTLRPQRSFHRPSTAGATDDHKSIPQVTQQQQYQLYRAKSQGRLRAGDDFHHSTLKPSFIEDVRGVPPVPAVPKISEEYKKLGRGASLRSAASTRPSMESSNGGGHINGGGGGGAGGGGGVERRSSSRRPSTADRDRVGQGQHRPPVPPLPPSVATENPGTGSGTAISSSVKPAQVTQQRVFIGDTQSYNIVEIEDSTSAGDVIEMLESRGSLKGWIGSGEWMVWEVAHDFGMERPIRHYERLSDVQASWNKDKLVNMFVARLTTLAPLLARSAIPSSSPIHSGYVEWESKRGKWSKRWLQLREHSLWISKRDNGKDETLLCSLSNFDAYHFTRPYKSPKPFAFAIKSTDKLSFFENTQDYKHVISCSEKDGKTWMAKILLARSYVLHQERNVLFNPKTYGGQPTVATNPGTLSRAATSRRPTQPLVSVANGSLFEPGSLLHRQG